MCSTVDCYHFELVYCCRPEGFRHRKLSSLLVLPLLFSLLMHSIDHSKKNMIFYVIGSLSICVQLWSIRQV